MKASCCEEYLMKDVVMYICRRDASNIYKINIAPLSNPQGIALNFPMTSRENSPVAFFQVKS
jgi:hypothetical protein